jgi:glycosyltransferase involved in cell wall biosynthesis
MNILYLTTHLNTGGITSYVLSLASALLKRGHKIFVASSGGQLVPQFIKAGITYIPIPIRTKQEFHLPKITVSLFKLLKIIRKENIEIIHSHTRVTQVLGTLLQYFSGKPHISTAHGFFKKRISRKLFPCWGKPVIAISESVKEHLVRDFKVKEKDIKIIYSGIDVSKFRGQKKKDLGLGDSLVIGIIARLSEEKGHLYLVEAMKSVLAKFPSAKLLIVGEGRMEKRIKEKIEELKIKENVIFLASVSDTSEMLAALDIFVMPSLKEGLGLSLMEAMASGLAVVASDVGGIKSLIKDGENGLLVRPADAAELCHGLLELLSNPQKREFLGRNARIYIEQNYSLESMVSQTENLYLECLNASSSLT